MNPIERFKRLTVANQANVIFGGIVTVATAGNLIVGVIQYKAAKETSKSNSDQTQQLIAASNRNAGAAESFSNSASSINRGIYDAVAKLQAQADKMDAARIGSERQSQQTLNATIDNFHREQRAWVGIHQATLTQFERGKPIIIDVEITNTGRTPATHVLKSAIEDSTLVPRDKPMPDRIESLQKSLPNSPGASLPPNGGYTMSFGRSISGTDQSEISASYDAIKSRQLVLYILGTVHYEDVFGISHNTNWCVWISNPDTKTEPVPEIRTVR